MTAVVEDLLGEWVDDPADTPHVFASGNEYFCRVCGVLKNHHTKPDEALQRVAQGEDERALREFRREDEEPIP